MHQRVLHYNKLQLLSTHSYSIFTLEKASKPVVASCIEGLTQATTLPSF